ncbi:MAG: hypothetical protein UY04_C0034G0007 [Parcubacteria group bacterium GW2011_GWA2_47_7]|nr:MAG: hypothetical protein UY04_C0034G0007 [Parcubacteria group bacterium GW2011_GWA2_47_7]
MNHKSLFEVETSIRSRLSGGLKGSRKDVSGLEFEEVREFDLGDLESSLHLGASARAGRDMVVVRIPDRRVEITLVIDTTASMFFGALGATKYDAALRMLLVAAQVAKENQAKLTIRYHAGTPSRTYLSEFPIRPGTTDGVKKQFAKFVNSLSEDSRARTFDLREALQSLVLRGKHQTLLVVVVSDFLYTADYEESLRALLLKKNTVVGVATLDSAEIALPSLRLGAFRVTDSETGATALMARSPNHYLDAHRALWTNLRATLEVVHLE